MKSHLREGKKEPWGSDSYGTGIPLIMRAALPARSRSSLQGVGGGKGEEDSDLDLEQLPSDMTVWSVMGEGWVAGSGC